MQGLFLSVGGRRDLPDGPGLHHIRGIALLIPTKTKTLVFFSSLGKQKEAARTSL